ncbi:acyl carrier protein [Lutibacter sp. HS1-25]|uniref:phosphopantetheine-binding protein n=1 Tax=Lutibacter sp. HS1-25 TaxID=2485000 RepID=UPI001010718F|nr:phosphopantetheine-binding protein [Lutibacter sp. HS1-25]RXP45413.1 acyl carrier protein [Lutibacter sp. HS1-25]
MNKDKIANFINEICDEKEYKIIDSNSAEFLNLNLRNDIGFDSFDLAHLTVMIEDEFDVDIFEDGIVLTIGEIIKKLE